MFVVFFEKVKKMFVKRTVGLFKEKNKTIKNRDHELFLGYSV